MEFARMRLAVFNIRKRSLVRGTFVVLASLAFAFFLAGFPESRASLKLLIPTALALYGMFETMRCLRARWSFYHGGVLLLVYMDVLALAMILFLLLFPYARWLLHA
jgi:hypothetical protein